MKSIDKAVLAASALVLAACGAGGDDGAARTGFPPEVAARIAQEEAYCADGMGALEPVALEALQTGEFNADGAADYVLSHGAFHCTEGGWPYCGSAGCSFTVFMSSPGGALTPIEMGNVQDYTIVRDGDRDVLDIAAHGQIVGADTAHLRLRWNGESFERQ
jgi:hypothetical protein